MTDWICSHCSAHNAPRVRACEDCGHERTALTTPNQPQRICPLDGAILQANGWCHTGNGFPLPLAHPPDACPHCRAFLRWDGDCGQCQPPGEKPGHRYDYDPFDRTIPTSAHWRVVEHGPQPLGAPTAEQNVILQRAFLPRVPDPKPQPILPRLKNLVRL